MMLSAAKKTILSESLPQQQQQQVEAIPPVVPGCRAWVPVARTARGLYNAGLLKRVTKHYG